MLHLLISAQHLDIIKWLLTSKYLQNVDVNSKDKNGWTPLHAAIMERNLDICEVLLQNEKTDVHAKSNDGNIPLHYLSRQQLEESTIPRLQQIINLMINKGVDIDDKNNMGETPLFNACFKGAKSTITFLIQKGAKINESNISGDTSVHYAVRRGDVEILSLMKSKVINLNARGPDGTPREVAKYYNNLKMMAFFDEEYNLRESKIHRLPEKFFFEMFSELDLASLGRLSCVCRLFRNLTSNNKFWHARYYIDFGEIDDTKVTEWKSFYHTALDEHRKRQKLLAYRQRLKEEQKKFEKKKISSRKSFKNTKNLSGMETKKNISIEKKIKS